MEIFFGMRHVELSNAFVYLTNIPNGVVESTILSKRIPAPLLKSVFNSTSSSGLGNNPYKPDIFPFLQEIFIGPQLAVYIILLGALKDILVSAE
jgi:hypothetical protein